MKKSALALLLAVLCMACSDRLKTRSSAYDLQFKELAKTWDEGIPLGNGVIGALVWQKDSALRMSLDRIDLWDLRPNDSLSGKNNRFKWVYEQRIKGDYAKVQRKFDAPYDRLPAPSKIPGAGIEFDLAGLGQVERVHLYLNDALCEVDWKDGVRMQSFVHATKPVGWFRFENVKEGFIPRLVPPVYAEGEAEEDSGPVSGLDLRRLGYKQGEVKQGKNSLVYHQKGWGDFFYEVAVKWEYSGNVLTGVWSVASSLSGENAEILADNALQQGIGQEYVSHLGFWNYFWKQSGISLPDTVLEKQYYNELYKFGSVARENSYPISLQAVWTADNGNLPPWKGDYHHDLNTQLSYWPAYTGNYLKEGEGYLNTLWAQKETNKRYTRQYFEVDGLNVPGVATLTGEPMGGWIQYAMSPTVSAWLAQHFYLHWQYSRDRDFLLDRAYPYLKEVAVFLEQFTEKGQDGKRRLPLSSSPEIRDNSREAWFTEMTNYDLALVKFVFIAASELAGEAGQKEEAAHWAELAGEFPDYSLERNGAMMFAPGAPYRGSHRHFSNAMAIHPLGLIDWSKGERDRQIIRATISNFDKYGPDYWTGYSYSWLGNMKARAFDGEGAAEALRIFAECFCLKNTFHANGDQSKSGKSRFTYRPFTLEGNFAFAAGIQEMLIQSHSGVIRLFPAIPKDWKDVSFRQLRTYGAFLISAGMKGGRMQEVTIRSEKGGVLKMYSPFIRESFKVSGNSKEFKNEGNILEIPTEASEVIHLVRE